MGMKVSEASINTFAFTMPVESTTEPEFIDVTDTVAGYVRASGIQNGFCLVFSKHTTAAITIQENEPLLLQDLSKLLETFSPRSASYSHNDFDVRTVNMHENECPNGHSHCRHLILGSSETIPVIDGALALGQFQRLFVVELDEESPNPREILVQLMGV
jgi:secondary thiamine-phosphate synthase enzyme